MLLCTAVSCRIQGIGLKYKYEINVYRYDRKEGSKTLDTRQTMLLGRSTETLKTGASNLEDSGVFYYVISNTTYKGGKSHSHII